MAATELKQLGKQAEELVPNKNEQAHIDLQRQLGVTVKLADKSRRIWMTDGPLKYMRVCNSHEERKALEKQAEGWADKLKAPVVLALPLDLAGGCRFFSWVVLTNFALIWTEICPEESIQKHIICFRNICNSHAERAPTSKSAHEGEGAHMELAQH